jgi:hypothetical protein
VKDVQSGRLPTFQKNVPIPNIVSCLVRSSTLEMNAMCLSETSVNVYQIPQRQISENNTLKIKLSLMFSRQQDQISNIHIDPEDGGSTFLRNIVIYLP